MGDGRETENTRKQALQARAQRATVGPGGQGVPLAGTRRRRQLTPEEQAARKRVANRPARQQVANRPARRRRLAG